MGYQASPPPGTGTRRPKGYEMTLGDQLAEENRRKTEKAKKERYEREQREYKEAEKESKKLFNEIIIGLPERIKAENRKGHRGLTVIEARGDKTFTLVQRHLMYLLTDWARENGLSNYHTPYERQMDWDQTESFTLTWK